MIFWSQVNRFKALKGIIINAVFNTTELIKKYLLVNCCYQMMP